MGLFHQEAVSRCSYRHHMMGVDNINWTWRATALPCTVHVVRTKGRVLARTRPNYSVNDVSLYPLLHVVIPPCGRNDNVQYVEDPSLRSG
jgi:hypothetical protein